MPTTTDPRIDSPGATVAGSVYGRIRDDIIFGSLEPGRKLKLDTLKTTYGVSVSTLREVLNRLAADGFAATEDQKGFRVSPVSMRGLFEVAELRELLECHGLRQSVANGDIDWEGRVVAAHHKLASLEGKMVRGEAVDRRLWKRYDREFHAAMISACGSASLMRVHAAVYDHFLRYQVQALEFRGQDAADEHHELLERVIGRDADGAARVLAEHVRKGVELAARNDALIETSLTP